MEVRFWGTRGSLPAWINANQVREKIRTALKVAINKGLAHVEDIDAFIEDELPFYVKGTYGTNTSCVEIRADRDFVICDAGSGLRDFGNYLLRTYGKQAPVDYHIFISHPHWDHIQGFPFFPPAYFEENRITIYGCHKNISEAFSSQQRSPFFPFDFKDLGADIRFVEIVPGKTYDLAGFRVSIKEQAHPGKSYGYRFEKRGKTVVYSTDLEIKSENGIQMDSARDFFHKADLLIFDAQYSLADVCTIKEDWGHSNNFVGVELAQQADVKHLCLFHQESLSNDRDLDKFLNDTKKLLLLLKPGSPLRIGMAFDGMVIEI